jgi:Golgi nucleoside diphosphatase
VIAAIDARAAKLGHDRTKYILSLVRQDLNANQAPRSHRFASEDREQCDHPAAGS